MGRWRPRGLAASGGGGPVVAALPTELGQAGDGARGQGRGERRETDHLAAPGTRDGQVAPLLLLQVGGILNGTECVGGQVGIVHGRADPKPLD